MSQKTVRKCPIDGEIMEAVELYGIKVDRSSHGVWLDRGELYEITEAERRQIGEFDKFMAGIRSFFRPDARPDYRGENPESRNLACPVCGDAMVVDTYHDVYIDRCQKRHGVWLDQGELETILERLKDDPNFLSGMRLRLSDMTL